MSYKSTLQEHNTLLQQAIDKANTLPDAENSVIAEDLSAELEAQAQLIALQTSKINELITELDGKASGGGSGSYETCTLEINAQSSDPGTYCYIDSVVYPTLDEQGNVIYQVTYPGTYREIQNVVVGEVVLVDYETLNESTIETSNVKIHYDDGFLNALICCTKANDTSVFSIADPGGNAEGV